MCKLSCFQVSAGRASASCVGLLYVPTGFFTRLQAVNMTVGTQVQHLGSPNAILIVMNPDSGISSSHFSEDDRMLKLRHF